MRPVHNPPSRSRKRRRRSREQHPADRARPSASPLLDAAGRVAASISASTIDVPPFSRSAMDGYAVIAADTAAATAIAGPPAHRRPYLHRAGAAHAHRSAARARKSRPARRCPKAPTRSSWSRRPLAAGDDHVDIFAAAAAGPEHRAARGRHLARRRRGAARRSAEPEPRRRAGRHRLRRAGGVRAAARRGAVHRATRSSTRAHRCARTDLRRQPLHARPPSSPPTAGCPSRIAPVPDTLDALVAALDGVRGRGPDRRSRAAARSANAT